MLLSAEELDKVAGGDEMSGKKAAYGLGGLPH